MIALLTTDTYLKFTIFLFSINKLFTVGNKNGTDS
jgi:hypothetical protein